MLSTPPLFAGERDSSLLSSLLSLGTGISWRGQRCTLLCSILLFEKLIPMSAILRSMSHSMFE